MIIGSFLAGAFVSILIYSLGIYVGSKNTGNSGKSKPSVPEVPSERTINSPSSGGVAPMMVKQKRHEESIEGKMIRHFNNLFKP